MLKNKFVNDIFKIRVTNLQNRFQKISPPPVNYEFTVNQLVTEMMQKKQWQPVLDCH